MAHHDPVRTDERSNDDETLPNLVTIVGRGVPATFECTVDGSLEAAADDPFADGTVVSGSAAEGAVDVGVTRLRFSGDMANVRVVDWNGVEAPESPSAPTIHVEYGASRER